ncbi:MAG: non-canonical purine NTP pyrophosphatase [Euryarchaeota archaeon]|nr:non-canonical purine NTP pyrophosphatase [Euryarchaeota archaeon]MBF14744.1 non-canonical purine NTP pyrophosphatase [Euryarchaeota archaeon]
MLEWNRKAINEALQAKPMRTVWFMTGNAGKVREAKHALEPLGFDVRQLTVEDVDIVEPQCDDLEIVARSKLEQARPHLPDSNDALMVEDAGLFVDTLNGFPGVYSAYILRTVGYRALLNLVEENESRGAQFEAVAALLIDDTIHVSRGVCRGTLASFASGNEGFGFDPIFIPDDVEIDGKTITTNGLTFADVDLSIKEQFSHRSKALDGLIELLSTPESASSS